MSHKDETEVEAEIHGAMSAPRIRTRKMTAKALEYTLKTKKKRLEQLCNSLEKIVTIVLDQMDLNKDDVDDIRKNYKRWLFVFELFIEVNHEYKELVPDTELEDHEDDWFQPRNQVMVEFKDTCERWFNKKGMERMQQHDDNISEFSYRHSVTSSVSDKSVMSAKRKVEKRKVELNIKASMLKQMAELEKEKLKLKQREDELVLQQEITINKAKCKVLDDLSRSSTVQDDERSQCSSSNNHRDAIELAKHLSKPKCELQTFSGDPLLYNRFLRQFKAKVVANCDDPEERLNYLEQYTSGEPQKIVIGYSYLDAQRGYDAAMKELNEKYGDQDSIVNAYVTKALSWPSISNAKELDRFAVFLTECDNAIQSIDGMKVLEYSENLKRIVSKLPYNMHDKWRNIVYQAKENGERVNFQQLVKYVRKEAKKATDPTFGRDAMSKPQDAKPNTSRLRSHAGNVSLPFSSDSTAKQDAFSKPCTYCKGPHTLADCLSLQSKPFYDRTDALRDKGLCFGCLRRGHQRRDCKHKATCTHCSGRHPSVLHVNGRIPPRSEVVRNDIVQKVGSHVGAGDEQVTMAVIPVKVHLQGSSRMITTYAFLDPGSNISFCTNQLMRQLGCDGKRLRLTMDTMGVKHTLVTQELKHLEVCDLEQKHTVSLPVVYSKDKIPISKYHIPTADDIKRWPHLSEVSLPYVDADIGLLLGNNIPDAYSPLEMKVGPAGTPHATRSRLGWIGWNIIRPGANQKDPSVNRINAAIEHRECCKNLEVTYQKSLNIDFPEREVNERREHSQEDKQFLQMMSDSKTISDGHFEFCLPFKDQSSVLSNNIFLAQQRLKSLKKKFRTQETFFNDYKQFMSTLLQNGYAERVPREEMDRDDGRTWYLPHHGIYHPRKPSKIRVVFDCSSKFHAVSLNDMLLQGPDLVNSLVSVLLKFRLEPVAVMGDIQKMFYQVKVQKSDRDCLRFLWWPDGDIQSEPVIYRMTVHLFGATSSPSVASLALHQAVEDNGEYFDPVITKAVKEHFYVDDFLCSVPTEDEAIKLVHDVRFLCELGGFRLTQWVTNRMRVLETIPDEDRSAAIKNIDFEKFPRERALGVIWDVHSDTFGFQIAASNEKATRRNVLSVVSSVYDPLGIASPFVLSAKILLQDLCRKSIDWDTELSGSDLDRWNQWIQELPQLENLKIPRCLKPTNYKDITSVQLHHFSDASDVGYGVATYIRYTTTCGWIHSTLLYSRSRVAPLKMATIPRMELTAAMVAVQISLKLDLDLLNATHTYWTDSMSVLRYIFNTSTRFHTFVANRIAKIHDCTKTEQWKYVESKTNPADIASRGTHVQGLLQDKYWLQGPRFLCTPEESWPVQPDSVSLQPNDPEVKRTVNTNITVTADSFLDQLLCRTSSWLKIKRVTGWILVMFSTLRNWASQRKMFTEKLSDTESDPLKIEQHVQQKMTHLKATCRSKVAERLKVISLPVDIVSQAERLLIQHVQRQYYHEEIAHLSSDNMGGCGVKPSSSLYKLDPFMKNSIVRVGGRLSRSNLPYDSKHQIVIPKQSPVAKLILYDIHKRIGHLGKNSMTAELRKVYWIPQVGSIIKTIVAKCVTCRRYRTKMCMQKMADLPVTRVTSDTPAFTHVGVDYFGPLEIRRGRATVKRYGVLFTCFASRAVHLEVAYSLDTNSCICAIRRFISRRGNVKTLQSDNGTNLVGAERELRENIDSWNQSKIGQTLQQRGIQWFFNPPAASHFGGVWERLIRMVRKILYSLMHDQVIHMDDEGLHTLLCEVECILNNRPITPMSDNPDDLDALTPNHLLLLEPGLGLPCGLFDKGDTYVRRRWRQVQYLADTFWRRWKDQYLHLLQERQKWLSPKRNMQVNDIVLVMDNTRNSWSMGKVILIIKDKQGLVRIAKIKTSTSVLERPVHKLSLLLEADEQFHAHDQ